VTPLSQGTSVDADLSSATIAHANSNSRSKSRSRRATATALKGGRHDDEERTKKVRTSSTPSPSSFNRGQQQGLQHQPGEPRPARCVASTVPQLRTQGDCLDYFSRLARPGLLPHRFTSEAYRPSTYPLSLCLLREASARGQGRAVPKTYRKVGVPSPERP